MINKETELEKLKADSLEKNAKLVVFRNGDFFESQFSKPHHKKNVFWVSYIDEEEGLLIMKQFKRGVEGVAKETIMYLETAKKLSVTPVKGKKNRFEFFWKKVERPAFEVDDKYVKKYFEKHGGVK